VFGLHGQEPPAVLAAWFSKLGCGMRDVGAATNRTEALVCCFLPFPLGP